MLSTFSSQFGRTLSKHTYTWSEGVARARLYWFKVPFYATTYRKLLIWNILVLHGKQQRAEIDLIIIHPEVCWENTLQAWALNIQFTPWNILFPFPLLSTKFSKNQLELNYLGISVKLFVQWISLILEVKCTCKSLFTEESSKRIKEGFSLMWGLSLLLFSIHLHACHCPQC